MADSISTPEQEVIVLRDPYMIHVFRSLRAGLEACSERIVGEALVVLLGVLDVDDREAVAGQLDEELTDEGAADVLIEDAIDEIVDRINDPEALPDDDDDE